MMGILPDLLFPLLFILGAAAITLYFLTEKKPAATRVEGVSVGVALAAMIGSLLMVLLPGEAYYLGLKTILPMLGLFGLLPFLSWNILPGLAGESIGSPLRYLMLRFNLPTAQAAGALFILGRLFLAAFTLALVSRMLHRATAELIPAILFLLILGAGATLSSAFSGLRGSLWLGALTTLFLLVGAVLAIAAVLKANGGADVLWKSAQQLDRTWLQEPRWLTREWSSIWLIVPTAFIAMLALLLGDETLYQPLRQLRAEGSRFQAFGVRAALVVCFVLLAALVIMHSYVGMGLAVFYAKQPREVRPQWVANVDPLTQLSLTDPATQTRVMLNPATGLPWIGLVSQQPVLDASEGVKLLDWNLPAQAVTPANLPQLLAEARLYHPNLKQPFSTAEQVMMEGNERIDPLKIASFRPAMSGRAGEIILHRRATEELWPYFVSTQTSVGLRGMFLAALLAAAWCVLDSSVQAIARSFALYITANQHRVHARTLPLLAGVSITLAATPVLIWFYFPAEWLIAAFAATLVPIAAVVFLGLTTRSTSSNGATVALLIGCFWTAGLALLILGYGKRYDAGIWGLHIAATIPFAFLVTLITGYVSAFVAPRTARRGELAGLVLGSIRIGDLRPEEADLDLELSEPEAGSPPARPR
jgi:Na+/pantothenate symporter